METHFSAIDMSNHEKGASDKWSITPTSSHGSHAGHQIHALGWSLSSSKISQYVEHCLFQFQGILGYIQELQLHTPAKAPKSPGSMTVSHGNQANKLCSTKQHVVQGFPSYLTQPKHQLTDCKTLVEQGNKLPKTTSAIICS